MGKALAAIVSDVTKVTDLIDGITKASEEQAQGVDQVNTAVSQMDKVTQQNAAGAEESASAAEQLSAQANTVKGVVNELASLVNGSGMNSSVTTIGRGSTGRKSGRQSHINLARLHPKGTKTSSDSASLAAVGHADGKANASDEFMSLDDGAGLDEY